RAIDNLKQKAVSNLKRAAELSNYDSKVTVRLLRAYHKMNQPEQGINLFETKIPASRQEPPVMLAYARLLAQRGDTQAAARVYCVALQAGGFGSFEFMTQVAALAYQSLGKEAAVQVFEQPPADVRLEQARQHILALLYQANNEFEQTMAQNQKLLDTATDDKEKVSILLRMGIAHTEMSKDFAAAKALYEQALEINPDSLMALNNLAFLLTDQLDQPSLAVPYAQRAANLSRSPAVVDTLGWAYLRLGRYREAIAQLTMARQEDVSYLPVAYHLGEAYRREGQFENAVELFNEVLRAPEISLDADYRRMAQEGLAKAESRSQD
ncbi:MAG: tetratricopeptide repeat protein, partial [FCB group bacterium]|nr:tetratricopeptide repeat protein [FCB group bacterium]